MKTLKTRLIQAIIRDRIRLIPMACGFVVWCALELTQRVGIQLTAEHQVAITTVATLVFSCLLDGWALDVTAAGATEAQNELRRLQPWIQTDGFVGPQTVGGVKALVDDVVAQESRDHRGQ